VVAFNKKALPPSSCFTSCDSTDTWDAAFQTRRSMKAGPQQST